jgi:hypothetical protein
MSFPKTIRAARAFLAIFRILLLPENVPASTSSSRLKLGYEDGTFFSKSGPGNRIDEGIGYLETVSNFTDC